MERRGAAGRNGIGESDAGDARLAVQALLERFGEGAQTRGVVSRSERELRGYDVLGVQAERDALEFPERAEHQAGGGQHDERPGDLEGDERVAKRGSGR